MIDSRVDVLQSKRSTRSDLPGEAGAAGLEKNVSEGEWMSTLRDRMKRTRTRPIFLMEEYPEHSINTRYSVHFCLIKAAKNLFT